MTGMVDRGHMLNVRVSDDELAMLRAVAVANGLTQSDMLRQLIRRAHEKLGQVQPKKKRK